MAGPLFGAIERAQLCGLFGELAGPGLVLPGARAAWGTTTKCSRWAIFTWLVATLRSGPPSGV